MSCPRDNISQHPSDPPAPMFFLTLFLNVSQALHVFLSGLTYTSYLWLNTQNLLILRTLIGYESLH